MSVIRKYTEWNSALWLYFFGSGDGNPILWIDEHVLEQAAKGKIKISKKTIVDDFISCTLLSQEKLEQFIATSRHWGINTAQVSDWCDLVCVLRTQRIRTADIGKSTESPAYFGMLCAIMYFACVLNVAITHNSLKAKTEPYFEKKPRKFGELVDGLFSQLHTDVNSFEEDGMTCGKQINISRLKYHSVLKSTQREDLKDLIEISNLKWEDEPYYDYVNNKLIPALQKAGRKDIIEIVVNPEYAPCIKSILHSELDYGKAESSRKNVRQAIQIKYKHELFIDVLGSPTFEITQNSWTPFSIRLSNGKFEIDTNEFASDSIATVDNLHYYGSAQLQQKGSTDIYEISSISQSEDILIFEKVGRDAYVECAEMQPGLDYLKFVKKSLPHNKAYTKLIQGGQKLENLSLGEYDSFQFDNYAGQQNKGKKSKSDNNIFNDDYKFNRVGPWCSIYLPSDEAIYWKPNIYGNAELIPLETFHGRNGRSYFRIPHHQLQTISGKIFVSKDSGKNVQLVDGKISHTFEWNGTASRYHLNGWGLTTTKEYNGANYSEPNSKLSIQKDKCYPTHKLNLLVYVLRDIADQNGCIGQRKMVNALNFILEYYGIIPTSQNRKSILYALRTLGYIIAYYNPQTREYENQLCSPYLEKVNYSINGNKNALLVKGFYSPEMYDCLVTEANRRESLTSRGDIIGEDDKGNYIENRFIRYRRPYKSSESNISEEHEYECLPDQILIELDNTTTANVTDYGWRIQNYTSAEKLVSIMEDISNFETAFGIDTGGDICYDPCYDNNDAPFMASVNQKEHLFSKRDVNLRIHKSFRDDQGYLNPIPKHIARVYCQVSKNQPIMIMQEYNTENEARLNYGEVLFTSGMGRPTILQMALCDLNLGLHNNALTFSADRETTFGNQQKDNHKLQIERGYTLATCATKNNHDTLKVLLSKMTGKHVDNIESCQNLYVRKPSSIDLWSYKNESGQYYVVATKGERTIALCKRERGIDNIYYLIDNNSGNKIFAKAIGDDPNKILSDIINKKEPETCADQLAFDASIEEDIKNKKGCRKIAIINNEKNN